MALPKYQRNTSAGGEDRTYKQLIVVSWQLSHQNEHTMAYLLQFLELDHENLAKCG
jgi:ribosomal protein L35AE/L33A